MIEGTKSCGSSMRCGGIEDYKAQLFLSAQQGHLEADHWNMDPMVNEPMNYGVFFFALGKEPLAMSTPHPLGAQ